jgi:hypothetical protein
MVSMESRGRVSVIVGTLVVGLVIGILLGFIFDKGTQVSPEAQPPATTGSGPFGEENGVPVGYARTEEGAVAAATNFSLLAADDDLLEVDALALAMETLAAPNWKAEARAQAVNGNEFVVDRYGTDADLTGAVLRYEVVEYSSDRAVVRLWTVSVVSGSNRPNVEEVWGTVTVNLVWVDGDWRVEGNESAPGPAPVDLPAGEPEQSASSLMEDFHEFSGAPTP